MDLSSSPLPMPSEPKPFLDLLAPEIVLMICKVLQQLKPKYWNGTNAPNDLPNFRSVNRRCAAIGAKVLCRSLHVMFIVKSFQNLMNVARHPVLSQYVSEIAYDAVFLEKVTKGAYKDSVLQDWLEVASEFGPGPDDTYEDLAVSMFNEEWKIYKLMFTAQEHMKAFKFDSATFAESFSRLPNLRNVRVDLDPDHYTSPWSPTLDAAYEDTKARNGS